MRVITLCATLLFAGVAFGQGPVQVYGPTYGPYVPLITTPQVSFQTVSPNAVGARNATYGLEAGARNSTLSMISGNTSSSFTVPVWYQGGGAPLVSEPEVALHVRPVHGGYAEHREMRGGEEHAAGTARAWTYFASLEEVASPVEASASARTARKATRTVTNQDVDQENQKTGTVKYNGKTEKIQ